MRILMLVVALSSLGGCALWMPQPDPNQAWIDLDPHGETELMAVAVDERPLKDDRYFQVAPGSHQLGMRYRFAVTTYIGLTLSYDSFNAGARYRLVAGGYGFRPWAKLYDQHDRMLAKATERGCGGVATR